MIPMIPQDGEPRIEWMPSHKHLPTDRPEHVFVFRDVLSIILCNRTYVLIVGWPSWLVHFDFMG